MTINKNLPKIILAFIITITILAGCKIGLPIPPKTGNPTKALTANNESTNKQALPAFPEWETVAPGIEFTSLKIPAPTTTTTPPTPTPKDLLIIKINPTLNRLKIAENQSPPNAKTIAELHKTYNSLLTVNGGFFTPEFNPTGLLISEGETLNSYSKADLLNGIFAIDTQNKPTIISPAINISPKKYPFAIQNGPVLIHDNTPQITKDDNKKASRTVIAINNANEIIIIILKQSLLNMDNALSLYQLAHLVKEDPALTSLNITSALNLDGGTSTGLYVKDRYYPEMEKVQNIIIVTP